MGCEMEDLFIIEILSLGEMSAGILEWPQIWPCVWWGMASKNIYYCKVDGITAYMFKQVDLSAKTMMFCVHCGTTCFPVARDQGWGLQGVLLPKRAGCWGPLPGSPSPVLRGNAGAFRGSTDLMPDAENCPSLPSRVIAICPGVPPSSATTLTSLGICSCWPCLLESALMDL